MKRNKAIARKMRSGVPPYTRAKREGNPKIPFRYSADLRQWEREMGARQAREAEIARQAIAERSRAQRMGRITEARRGEY